MHALSAAARADPDSGSLDHLLREVQREDLAAALDEVGDEITGTATCVEIATAMFIEKIEDVALADEEIVVRERDFGDVKGSPLLRDFVKMGPDQPSLLHLVHCYSFVPSCGNGE